MSATAANVNTQETDLKSLELDLKNINAQIADKEKEIAAKEKEENIKKAQMAYKAYQEAFALSVKNHSEINLNNLIDPKIFAEKIAKLNEELGFQHWMALKLSKEEILNLPTAPGGITANSIKQVSCMQFKMIEEKLNQLIKEYELSRETGWLVTENGWKGPLLAASAALSEMFGSIKKLSSGSGEFWDFIKLYDEAIEKFNNRCQELGALAVSKNIPYEPLSNTKLRFYKVQSLMWDIKIEENKPAKASDSANSAAASPAAASAAAASTAAPSNSNTAATPNNSNNGSAANPTTEPANNPKKDPESGKGPKGGSDEPPPVYVYVDYSNGTSKEEEDRKRSVREEEKRRADYLRLLMAHLYKQYQEEKEKELKLEQERQEAARLEQARLEAKKLREEEQRRLEQDCNLAREREMNVRLERQRLERQRIEAERKQAEAQKQVQRQERHVYL